jgi:hypothetical protein
MIEYSFSKTNARKISQIQVFKRLPFLVIAGFLSLYLVNYDSGGTLFRDSLILFLAAALLMASLLATGLFLGIEFRVKNLLKEKYILSDAFIEKRTISGNYIKIDLSNIEFFIEKNNGFLIRSNDDEILIPRALDGYQELKTKIIEKLRK